VPSIGSFLLAALLVGVAAVARCVGLCKRPGIENRPSLTRRDRAHRGWVPATPAEVCTRTGRSVLVGRLLLGRPCPSPGPPTAGSLPSGRSRTGSGRWRSTTTARPMPFRPRRPARGWPWPDPSACRRGFQTCLLASGLICPCSEERSQPPVLHRYQVLDLARERQAATHSNTTTTAVCGCPGTTSCSS
jgi:hypothetical protein